MPITKSEMKITFLFILSGIILLSSEATGQKKNDKQLSNRVIAFSPEEQLKGFRLPPGFVIELVASEKDGVVKPIDLAFDDAGNLWTQTATMYPLDPISDIQWNDLLELMNNKEKQDQHPAFKRVSDLYKGVTKGEDKILKLTGIYNGSVKAAVWADGLAIPMSILPFKTGAFVAQGSEIFLLDDRDNDGKADTREPLFTGFGFTDSHTMTHLLRKGPGNWIHFSHGALNRGVVSSYADPTVKTAFDYSKIGRFSKNGRKIEVLTAGLNNIWGYTLRADGAWYGSEANDIGYSVVPLEEGAAFPGIGGEKFRPYQPFYPSIHSFRVGGTGLSGLAFSEDDRDGFPEYWKHVGFLANPITNTINAVRIVRNADGSIASEKLEDLLVSEDDWFRPVNISFGPDGCLYIADWYNKIVSHNEVPTSHPDRDKNHGRIWRIRHESQPARKIVDFYTVKTADLPAYLQSPYLWERRAAWNQISERDLSETSALLPELVKMVNDNAAGTSARIHALWSLEALSFFDKESVGKWLSDLDDQVRREALRFLTSYPEQIGGFVPQYRALINDPNAAVRSQLIRTLGQVNEPEPDILGLLVQACRPDAAEEQVGGPYEQKFERYLARRELEAYPDRLDAFLREGKGAGIPAANILWAIQVLPSSQRSAYYFQYAQDVSAPDLPEATFLDLAGMAEQTRAKEVLTASMEHPDYRMKYLNQSLKHQAVLNTPDYRELLKKPVSFVLKSGTKDEKKKALEVISAFGLAIPEEIIAQTTEKTQDEPYLGLTVKALDVAKSTNAQPYLQIAENQSLSLNTRLNALQGVVRTDRKLGRATIEQWLEKMDAVEKRTLTNVLSRYTASSALLLELYGSKKILESDFEIMTAERIHSLVSDKAAALRLVEAIRQKDDERKKMVASRIQSLKAVADHGKGDIEKGKLLFQTCLMCHQVGGNGQNIAPALDGLGYRDPEGLLHAVLDPDAAIEAGYALFRVVKKDDSVLEGYLVKRDNTGTTLASMGGAQTFTAATEIRSQHHVAGKSFMPTGLFDNLSEKEVADILSFMKTIK